MFKIRFKKKIMKNSVDVNKLTKKEIDMLDTIIKYIGRKPEHIGSKCILTGSLSLALYGLNKRRVSDDIDICEYGGITQPLDVLLVEDFDDYDSEFLEYNINNFKVHHLSVRSDIVECCEFEYNDFTFTVISPVDVVLYKVSHSLSKHGHPEKHKLDIEFLLKNNSWLRKAVLKKLEKFEQEIGKQTMAMLLKILVE